MDDGRQPATTANSKLKTQNSKLLLLSGLCCGLAFSTKYYGFAVGVVLGVALVGVALYGAIMDRRALGQFVPGIVAFAGGIMLLGAPWLIRNFVAAGNPVWPLAGGVFGGAYWSPVRELAPETLLGSAPPLGFSNLWTGIEYLWTATTRATLAIDNQAHAVNLGYLLLPTLFLLPFARWKPSLTWIGYVAAAYWLLWAFFFSRTSARYLSTFYLLAALLGAYAVISVAMRIRWIPARWLLGSVVGSLLVLGAGQNLSSLGPYLPPVFALDRGTEAGYLDRYMEDYPMVRHIEERTPPDARIYVWDGQPRGYYIRRDYVYARLVPLYTGFGSEPEAWRARLAELGITHMLVHQRDILAPGQPVGQDPALEAGRRFAERYFSPPLFQVRSYTLYELR